MFQADGGGGGGVWDREAAGEAACVDGDDAEDREKHALHRINLKIKSIGVSNICFKCVKIKLKNKNAGLK